MEYVQWPNGITVGAIEVAPDVRGAAGLADAGELGIVVANRISFKKGKGWKEYGAGAPEHLG